MIPESKTAQKNTVIKGVTYFLAHVPNMVRHGSKPTREIESTPNLLKDFIEHQIPFDKAVSYAPNQVYIGNLDPDDLRSTPMPWWKYDVPSANRQGPFGEIMPEEEFLGMMKICDEFEILILEKYFLENTILQLKIHPLLEDKDIEKLDGKGVPLSQIEKFIEQEGAMPLYIKGDKLIGCCRRAHEEDFNLIPDILIENLTNKASGAMALRHLNAKFGCQDSLEYLIGCGEEAVGDRYNRGGGNMAKAIGELANCQNATGSDTKAFCCAPVHAIILGSGLISSGIFNNVAVVAGGSFAKLGMKFRGHLKNGMPILEDVIAGIAILLGEDDKKSPVVRLDSIGKHSIGTGSSQQMIFEKLVVEPLENLNLQMTDIDKFATEMHNPELTVPQGSGDVPRTNYRIIGSIAAIRGEINKTQIEEFSEMRGMLGFSPTQGHIASAVPVLGHAVRDIMSGKMKRVQFFAKGSLFLGRMTQLSDGVSFILEGNNGGD